MKAPLLILILLACVTPFALTAQSSQVKSTISTTDTADLNIISIAPDSFPTVSVVFKAETRKGEPVWDLTHDKMKARENGIECEVLSLIPISKNKTINLSIVLDHSGSMLQDASQLFDGAGRPRFYFDYSGQLRIPGDYKTPLEYAQRAVKSFIKSFNTEKDLVSVTGFSSEVAERIPLTHDLVLLNQTVEAMVADGGTALYDAMIAGMEQLADTSGIKVLVVLTDGEDNVSKHTWTQVAAFAKSHEIQVYIIGLGDVNATRLKQIAAQTGGEFRHTKNSASLMNLYASISKKIQAFYELVYVSQNVTATDTVRSISLSFDIPNTYLVSNPRSIPLPAEVITLLQTKERNRSYLMYGGILIVSAMSGGSLLYLYKRKKSDNQNEEV